MKEGAQRFETGLLGSRIFRMAKWGKGEIAVGDAICEAADGQIMETCRKILRTLPFTLRETGSYLRVFSRGMIGTDLFCKRITLTQGNMDWRVG